MKGLVLEGGGAKGSYQVGAYKAILEEGIQIDGITGTSIGALNGAMIVQGDFELCCEIWKNVTYSMLIDTSDEEIKKIMEMRLNREDLSALGEKFKRVVKNRGFDITPLKKNIDLYIDEEKIRNSHMDFGMVTVNVSDLEPLELFVEDIPKGKLNEYLLASSHLPIFKTEPFGGKYYLDGAFYDNLPYNLLIKKGYKDLILVRTYGFGLTRRIDDKDFKATVIAPSEDIGRSYDISPERVKRNIKLGYYDGLRVLRGLCGTQYCIVPEANKESYFQYLISIEDEKINEIGNLLDIPDVLEKRALFEFIIPRLASLMDLNKEFTYEEFLMELLEIKAKNLKIDKFHIYTFDELIQSIRGKKAIKTEEAKSVTPWEKILERVDLPTIFNKDEIILEAARIIFDND